MKARAAFLTLALAVTAEVAPAGEKFPELAKADGTVFRDVTVMKASASEIRIMHADGLAAIPLADLTPELQRHFGYDPERSAKESEVLAKERAEAARQVNAILRARGEAERADIADRHRSELVAKFESENRRACKAKVSQMVEGGALCKVQWFYRGTWSGLQPEPVFVRGLSGLADGEWWEGYVFPAGIYRYETVLGAGKSVRQYATNAEEAMELAAAE